MSVKQALSHDLKNQDVYPPESRSTVMSHEPVGEVDDSQGDCPLHALDNLYGPDQYTASAPDSKVSHDVLSRLITKSHL